MYGMFDGANLFNQDIGNWDTSNVIYMNKMFFNAVAFNQNIENWNTSKVLDMSYMFESFPSTDPPHSFNKPLNDWDVSMLCFKGCFTIQISTKIYLNGILQVLLVLEQCLNTLIQL